MQKESQKKSRSARILLIAVLLVSLQWSALSIALGEDTPAVIPPATPNPTAPNPAAPAPAAPNPATPNPTAPAGGGTGNAENPESDSEVKSPTVDQLRVRQEKSTDDAIVALDKLEKAKEDLKTASGAEKEAKQKEVDALQKEYDEAKKKADEDLAAYEEALKKSDAQIESEKQGLDFEVALQTPFEKPPKDGEAGTAELKARGYTCEITPSADYINCKKEGSTTGWRMYVNTGKWQQIIHGDSGVSLLQQYAQFLYKFLAGFVGIIAVLLIVIGGIQISTAGANQEGLQKGRERIIAAIVGLTLLFLSGLILYTLNPTFFSA